MWSITGRLLETLQASVLDLPYLIADEPPARHVATQLSQRVGRDRLALGVRRPSRRSTAFLNLGLKPRMPSRMNAAFIRSTIRFRSPTRLSRSRLGRLGIFILDCRYRDHLAAIMLAPQPTEKARLSNSVSRRSVGAPVLARYRYARGVNDMRLDVTRPEPSRQPETVMAGLEGDRDAFDTCVLPPRLARQPEQLQQGVLIDLELLRWLAFDARHSPCTSQPDRLISITAISVPPV